VKVPLPNHFIALHALNQVNDFDLQRVGDDFQSLDGDICFSTLDFADMRPMQARSFREDVLCQLAPKPPRPDV
jgi:hypothetical protein